jgi:hypothetical protein
MAVRCFPEAGPLSATILDQLAERRLVQDVQHVFELFMAVYPGSEVLTIGLA